MSKVRLFFSLLLRYFQPGWTDTLFWAPHLTVYLTLPARCHPCISDSPKLTPPDQLGRCQTPRPGQSHPPPWSHTCSIRGLPNSSLLHSSHWLLPQPSRFYLLNTALHFSPGLCQATSISPWSIWKAPPCPLCRPPPNTLCMNQPEAPLTAQMTSDHFLLKTLHTSHRPEDRIWTHLWDLCKTLHSDPSQPLPILYYLSYISGLFPIHTMGENNWLLVGQSPFPFHILFSYWRLWGFLFPRFITCKAL